MDILWLSEDSGQDVRTAQTENQMAIIKRTVHLSSKCIFSIWFLSDFSFEAIF